MEAKPRQQDKLSGSHEQALDERSRVTVPARHLPALRELCGVKGEEPVDVVVSVTLDKTLAIYPKPVFWELLNRHENAHPDDLAAARIARNLRSFMDEATLDKQNRVRILPIYAKKFSLTSNVVLKGRGDHLEVVSYEAWEQQFDTFVDTFHNDVMESRAFRRSLAKNESAAEERSA